MDPGSFTPEFTELVEGLRRDERNKGPAEAAEDARHGGVVVQLPLPHVEDPRRVLPGLDAFFPPPIGDSAELEDSELELAGDSEQERELELDRAQLGLFEPEQLDLVTAKVRVSGPRQELVAFDIDGLCYVKLHTEQRWLTVQLRAKATWGLGIRDAVSKCVALWTWLTLGEGCTIETSFEFGWKVTHVELCSDFQDVPFFHDDALAFVGPKKHARLQAIGRDGREVETLNLGSRSGDRSMCIYDKTRQILMRKNGDASTYLARWRQSPDFDEDAPVRRVELRFGHKSLTYEDVETGETINLRDPSVCFEADMLRKVWAQFTSKWRMVDMGGATRKERCPVDQRWRHVQAAADCEVPEWRQTRAVNEAAHGEAITKTVVEHERALAKLRLLLCVTDDVDDAQIGEFARRRAARDGFDRSRYAQNYYAYKHPFIGHEMAAKGPEFWAEVMETEMDKTTIGATA